MTFARHLFGKKTWCGWIDSFLGKAEKRCSFIYSLGLLHAYHLDHLINKSCLNLTVFNFTDTPIRDFAINNMQVAVVQMTVIQHGDVTVPHAEWSWESEAACKCQRLVDFGFARSQSKTVTVACHQFFRGFQQMFHRLQEKEMDCEPKKQLQKSLDRCVFVHFLSLERQTYLFSSFSCLLIRTTEQSALSSNSCFVFTLT